MCFWTSKSRLLATGRAGIRWPLRLPDVGNDKSLSTDEKEHGQFSRRTFRSTRNLQKGDSKLCRQGRNKIKQTAVLIEGLHWGLWSVSKVPSSRVIPLFRRPANMVHGAILIKMPTPSSFQTPHAVCPCFGNIHIHIVTIRQFFPKYLFHPFLTRCLLPSSPSPIMNFSHRPSLPAPMTRIV